MQNTIHDNQVTKPFVLRNWIRCLFGILTGLAGLVNMLTAIFPRPGWDILLGDWPVDTHHGAHQLLVVIGFFLLMLSYGMMRGKRHAWLATTLLLLISGVLYLSGGGPVFATLLTVPMILLLIAFARHFRAKSDPPAIRRGYIALLMGLSIVIVYTIGGLVVLYDQFESLIDRFGPIGVVFHLLTNSHRLEIPYSTQAFLFGHVLHVLCLSAVLYGIAMILRPVAAVLLPDDQERLAAFALTHTYGTNSISYFALEASKSLYFSNSRKSFISYVLEGKVAVVAGDPIGPQDELLPIIAQFISFCAEQDWTIVFWQVRDVYAELYRQAGMHLLKIGEDCVVYTDGFTLKGKAMANARTSARHAEKCGLRIIFYHGQVHDASQLTQMEQISRAWLARKGSTEMGFSMGRFDAHGDDEQMYALAVDADNHVYGFVSFVPIYGRRGWGIDLMRRRAQIPGGTMELLIVRSIEHLKDRGAEVVSLGLAPMSNSNHSDETLLESGIDFLANFVGNLGQRDSLYNFKKKFQPTCESRYLVYSSTLQLPRVGWALYRAHSRNVTIHSVFYRTITSWLAIPRNAHQENGMAGLPDIGNRNAGSTGELLV